MRGPKKLWVLKKQIIYVVDIFSSTVETHIMVIGLWLLTTHGGVTKISTTNYLP